MPVTLVAPLCCYILISMVEWSAATGEPLWRLLREPVQGLMHRMDPGNTANCAWSRSGYQF